LLFRDQKDLQKFYLFRIFFTLKGMLRFFGFHEISCNSSVFVKRAKTCV